VSDVLSTIGPSIITTDDLGVAFEFIKPLAKLKFEIPGPEAPKLVCDIIIEVLLLVMPMVAGALILMYWFYFPMEVGISIFGAVKPP